MSLLDRGKYSQEILEFTNISVPKEQPLIEYEVRVDDGDWHLWKKKVP